VVGRGTVRRDPVVGTSARKQWQHSSDIEDGCPPPTRQDRSRRSPPRQPQSPEWDQNFWKESSLPRTPPAVSHPAKQRRCLTLNHCGKQPEEAEAGCSCSLLAGYPW